MRFVPPRQSLDSRLLTRKNRGHCLWRAQREWQKPLELVGYYPKLCEALRKSLARAQVLIYD